MTGFDLRSEISYLGRRLPDLNLGLCFPVEVCDLPRAVLSSTPDDGDNQDNAEELVHWSASFTEGNKQAA